VFDENISHRMTKVLAYGLKTDGWHNLSDPDDEFYHFRATSDLKWMSELGRKGYVVVTADNAA